MQDIKVLRWQENKEFLEKFIKQFAVDCSPLRILEAGCGQRWPLDLRGIQYTITGVDLDKDALEIRKTQKKDLDETVLGDLRTVDLNNKFYDIIYCAFVLEHISNAEQALNNISQGLKTNGLLILIIPDRSSVYGLMTRITPFWVHVLYGKYIKGNRNAGKPGFGPYPTFHETLISREGIHKYCQENDYAIREEYGTNMYLYKGSRIAQTITRFFVIAISLFSLGKLRWEYENLTYVLQKKAGRKC